MCLSTDAAQGNEIRRSPHQRIITLQTKRIYMHEAKKRGWPLTLNDIVMERVQFEDRVLHAECEEEPVPDYILSYEVPTKITERTPLYAFLIGILNP